MGEHTGFINKLAEMDAVLTKYRPLLISNRIVPGSAAPHSTKHFSPWTNAIDHEMFRETYKKMIECSFTVGLSPGQRWGFKEIRYHRVATARFLLELFPDAYIVLLSREIEQLAVSNILADWSLVRIKSEENQSAEALAHAVVSDVVYALLAIEHDFDLIYQSFPGKCFRMDYSDLAMKSMLKIKQMFDALKLECTDELLAGVETTLGEFGGRTDKTTNVQGLLDEVFIRGRAKGMAEAMRTEIQAIGVDRGRLRSRCGVGRFSGLVGDHNVMNEEWSTMF